MHDPTETLYQVREPHGAGAVVYSVLGVEALRGVQVCWCYALCGLFDADEGKVLFDFRQVVEA